MEKYQIKQKGVTLLEVMLVLAIVGGLMVMAINYGTRQAAQQRRDKTALQVQQILNAGLAYYEANGGWPVPSGTCNYNSSDPSGSGNGAFTDLTILSGAGYLPSNMSNNSYGQPYKVSCDSVTGSVFYVLTQMNNRANTLIVSGEVPVGFPSDQNGAASSSGLYVLAQVTTPGQNLNNARSLNFAGIYHNGACVPVPACPGFDPTQTPPACNNPNSSNCMIPQIMVAPASVSGVNDTGTNNAYPITSFTAYAIGPGTNTTLNSCPYMNGSNLVQAPEACEIGANGIASPSGLYWRVCMEVVTSKGIVSTNNTNTGDTPTNSLTSSWGQFATMVVMTRCTPPNEPFGSDFTVYTR